MYDALAYLGLGLLAVLAALFLVWFGNYTAAMYGRLYGDIPKPPQQPQTRRQYQDEVVRYTPPRSFMSYCTSVCSSAIGYVGDADWR